MIYGLNWLHTIVGCISYTSTIMGKIGGHGDGDLGKEVLAA